MKVTIQPVFAAKRKSPDREEPGGRCQKQGRRRSMWRG